MASYRTGINYQVSVLTVQSCFKNFSLKFSAFMLRNCHSQFANFTLEPTFLQALNVVLIYDINTVPALHPGPAFIAHSRRRSFG